MGGSSSTGKYPTQYDSVFAEIRLTVAPTQQRVGDWVSVYTYEGKDGVFDVVLRRESTVTNSSLVDKSNFLFKEFVPAPSGSTVMVKVSGMPSSTLVVDQDGLITKNFDVDAGKTVMVGMEVTVVSAVKMEEIGAREVVAAVPRTINEHEFKVTNMTDTTLRGLVLTFQVDGVVGVVDGEGKPLEFWDSESTEVEIPILEPYGETTLTLSAETIPDLPEMVEILVKWKIWGIPVLAITFILGAILCWMGRRTFGPATHLIALCMPTLILLWALTARPSRPGRSWFLKNSHPSRGWGDDDTLFLSGIFLAFLVLLGLMSVGMGLLGLFAFFFVWVLFSRAAMKLEQQEGAS